MEFALTSCTYLRAEFYSRLHLSRTTKELVSPLQWSSTSPSTYPTAASLLLRMHGRYWELVDADRFVINFGE